MALQKLAFLFLTISNIYHEQCWLNFFKGYEQKYSIYIHSKEPLKISPFKQYELSRKIPTSWENTMRAQIELLRVALEDPENSKFVFISDSTIPLQAFPYVYKTLMKHPHSQFNYSFNYHKERNFAPIPTYKQYKNSQWIVLNRKHAELMVNDTHYIPIFDRYPYDNEHYPSTFLVHKSLEHEIVKQDTTLVIWYRNLPHPHMFKDVERDMYLQTLIGAITSKKLLFARKFAQTCDLTPLAQYRPHLFSKDSSGS